MRMSFGRLATLIALFVGLTGAYVLAESDTRPSIIFVKQTPVDSTGGTIADIFNNVVGDNPAQLQPVGGGLFRLDPDGTLTNLTPFDNIAVRDPEISYDGTRVMFSMKRGGRGKWQIYEMPVDGGALTHVYDSQSNDWAPKYAPDGRILFLSDRQEALARINENISDDTLPEGKLFIMNADGSHIQLVNGNPHGSFSPFFSSSGQIVYTQWDLNDLRANPTDPPDGISYSRFLIWETMVDGSREGHPIFGSHLVQDFAGGFTEAREIPNGNGEMVAVLTRSHYSWGAGSLVRFMPRTNPDTEQFEWVTSPQGYELLETNTAGRYRSPYPLADGRIIASYAAGTIWDGVDVPDFDLVIVDEGGEHRVIHADADYWDWQAVPVLPREVPPLAEPQTLEGYDNYAIVNTLDVALRNRNASSVANGDFQPLLDPDEIAAVRFFALDRPPAPYAGGNADDQVLLTRYLGTVPVADDGSFAAIVPARTMLRMDVVDEDGNVLVVERVWQEYAPGEVRACGGCHTPPDTSAGRTSNSAIYNPVNLTDFDVDEDDDGVVDLIAAYLAARDD